MNDIKLSQLEGQLLGVDSYEEAEMFCRAYCDRGQLLGVDSYEAAVGRSLIKALLRERGEVRGLKAKHAVEILELRNALDAAKMKLEAGR